ncbi:MAG TPA: ABC transporter permease [Candidatus Acidoferrales bacterium]|nr:ABC transporter permease [Candidatus Acidoferrales bacterium]
MGAPRALAGAEPAAAMHAVPVKRIVPPGRWPAWNLGELREYRELLYFLVWREIKVRYKQTLIGVGWAILQPVATMLVFSLFFGRLAKIPSGGLPYPLFFYTALLPWTYFAGALGGATGSVVENQRVITKVYFPRVLLPLSAVFSGLVDFAIAFVLLICMALYYRVTPGPWLVFVPLFLLLAMLTALGAGLWLAALNALYRDVRYVVPFLIQFWMFASPVAYPSSLVPERWRVLYGLNPMTGVIDGFRWAVTGQNPPSAALLAASGSAVIVMLVVGLWYFRRMEATVADVV